MHNTQSRLPVNDNDVVTSIATIGTFEAVVFSVLIDVQTRSGFIQTPVEWVQGFFPRK